MEVPGVITRFVHERAEHAATAHVGYRNRLGNDAMAGTPTSSIQTALRGLLWARMQVAECIEELLTPDQEIDGLVASRQPGTEGVVEE